MSRLDWGRDGRDWPQREASSFVEADGLNWHVQQAGQGPVLLLLHGTGAATHSWRGLWPLLAPHFTLIAPDLPGHGFTGMLGDLSLPAMSKATAALVARLGVEPAAVVGHSAGAAIAIRLALDGAIAPRMIAGIGGALLPFPGPAAVLFPAMARLLFLNPVVPQLFTFTAGFSGELKRFLARSTGSEIDAAGALFYGRLFRSSSHVASALGMMAAWDLSVLERDIPRLDIPLVLLHGSEDKAVPPRVATDVARRAARGTAVPLQGLGHLPHEEAPGVVAGHLLVAARREGVLPAEPGRMRA
jgi:magnesium chelatase accessory protein